MRVGFPKSESEIQRAVFAHLRERAFPGAVYWAVPNNPAARRTAGFLAGASDVHILHKRELFTLELKTENGTPGPGQFEFIKRIQAAGGYASMEFGLENALAWLKAMGVIR